MLTMKVTMLKEKAGSLCKLGRHKYECKGEFMPMVETCGADHVRTTFT
jgi:hypothetical protein